jgi:hypothetical protein
MYLSQQQYQDIQSWKINLREGYFSDNWAVTFSELGLVLDG